ncbi:hypothetical protein D3218_13855 [Aureimonas flava]|uniref:Uncharacterized protein n=1 Tax=Aureimonas flava TaxID=2320271 RepID=A0A3A1WIT8_9HYPH|nr:hypothetical protein [Aureimonas flava]RIX99552.1 hypothetical protein D3218_13855 [Aureimonas flava]
MTAYDRNATAHAATGSMAEAYVNSPDIDNQGNDQSYDGNNVANDQSDNSNQGNNQSQNSNQGNDYSDNSSSTDGNTLNVSDVANDKSQTDSNNDNSDNSVHTTDSGNDNSDNSTTDSGNDNSTNVAIADSGNDNSDNSTTDSNNDNSVNTSDSGNDNSVSNAHNTDSSSDNSGNTSFQATVTDSFNDNSNAWTDSFNSDDDLIDIGSVCGHIDDIIGAGQDALSAAGGQALLGDGNVFSIHQTATLNDGDWLNQPSTGLSNGSFSMTANDLDGGTASASNSGGHMAGDSSEIAAGTSAAAGITASHEALTMDIAMGANIQFTSVDMNVVGGDAMTADFGDA